MALADYFHRSAIAAAQVVAGFDEAALAERVNDITVELSIDETGSQEASALIDMTVRLLARFYPRLKITGGGTARTRYLKLARAINPNIEFARGRTDFAIAIGSEAASSCAHPIFAGSDGWDAQVSTDGPVRVGTSANPFGSGAAACLAVGEVFRQVFDIDEPLSGLRTLSVLDLDSRPTVHNGGN